MTVLPLVVCSVILATTAASLVRAWVRRAVHERTVYILILGAIGYGIAFNVGATGNISSLWMWLFFLQLMVTGGHVVIMWTCLPPKHTHPDTGKES